MLTFGRSCGYQDGGVLLVHLSEKDVAGRRSDFYGCSGSAGTGGVTSVSSQTAAAAADTKLDGIQLAGVVKPAHASYSRARAAGSSRDWAFE